MASSKMWRSLGRLCHHLKTISLTGPSTVRVNPVCCASSDMRHENTCLENFSSQNKIPVRAFHLEKSPSTVYGSLNSTRKGFGVPIPNTSIVPARYMHSLNSLTVVSRLNVCSNIGASGLYQPTRKMAAIMKKRHKMMKKHQLRKSRLTVGGKAARVSAKFYARKKRQERLKAHLDRINKYLEEFDAEDYMKGQLLKARKGGFKVDIFAKNNKESQQVAS